MYINQLNNTSVLASNIANMKHVLFYNKYVFDSRLQTIISNNAFYTWILKSYERSATTIVTNKQGGELTRLNKSVHYTKLFLFFVNTDTIDYINHRGRTVQDKVPLIIDRYSLPIWEVLSYDVRK
jgi:hypothetical protein